MDRPIGVRLLKATPFIGIAAASIVVIAGTASAQLPLPPVDQTEEEVEDTLEETVDEVEETVDETVTETVDGTTGTVDDPVSTTDGTAEATSETVTAAAGTGSVAPGSGAQGGSSTGPSGKGDRDRTSGSGGTEVAVPASSREMMAAQPAGPAAAAEAAPSGRGGRSPKVRWPDFDSIPQGGQVILLVAAASLLALLGLGALGYRFYPRTADGPRLFSFDP